jgi:hypothetical protein
MRTVAILFALLLPMLAAAEQIYRSTDEQGNPVFTDEPTEGAEPVPLDPLTTVPAGEAPEELDESAPDNGQSESQPETYQGIEITYPPSGQAVRHNGGMVPFRVELKGRKLAEGHRVEILLDGEVRGSGSSTQVSVSPVNRGSHTVVARIVDAQGSPLIASSPVDFHLLRASVGN